ncbi:MAG: KpsF/GutQ family sugar-phosphate isomerase [Sphingobacteriia bacterium]|nr:MAG: KpsF/GutQ family sugar-phosphate isomerase [Sphingobacteriia bacterium]
MKPSLLDLAKKTIQLEARSIAALEGLLGKDFDAIVDAIQHAKGRLVVSGIGKSAIVAQKIVATLNSTGSPSLFMHAADAIHGDLGMVTPDDVVMVISKSGESPEIKVLVPLIKNFGNPLIGMVGNKNSFLAQAANWVLDTTVDQEACPNNLAPTSSTTAQMVMGDVLAVCLMEKNNFKDRDFARFHPGGNLGKKLYLQAGSLAAAQEKPAVLAHAPLQKVIVEITQKRLGVTAVVDEMNQLKGIITDGDLRRMLEKTTNLAGLTAKDIYSKDPVTIGPDALAITALDLLREKSISQLVVAENGQYLGILHLHDLVREGLV